MGGESGLVGEVGGLGFEGDLLEDAAVEEVGRFKKSHHFFDRSRAASEVQEEVFDREEDGGLFAAEVIWGVCGGGIPLVCAGF